MEKYRSMQLKINDILEQYDVLQSEQAIKQLKEVVNIYDNPDWDYYDGF